jgi:hypothetical protein
VSLGHGITIVRRYYQVIFEQDFGPHWFAKWTKFRHELLPFLLMTNSPQRLLLMQDAHRHIDIGRFAVRWL